MTATAPPLTGAEAALARLRPTAATPTTSAPAAATPPTPPTTSVEQVPAQPPRGAATRPTAPPAVQARLIPHLSPGSRPRPAIGPGPVRPPTLEERALERRRNALRASPTTTPDEPREDPLPEPTSVCCSIVLVALESLTGARSLQQLARWVTPELYEQLAARAAVTERAVGADRPAQRPEVRRARVCRLGRRVAEATIVVQDGSRVRAVAVRVEERRGAWRAVALEIG